MNIGKIFLLRAWHWFERYCSARLLIIFTCTGSSSICTKRSTNTTESIASESDRCTTEYKWGRILYFAAMTWCLAASWIDWGWIPSLWSHRKTKSHKSITTLHANLWWHSWPRRPKHNRVNNSNKMLTSWMSLKEIVHLCVSACLSCAAVMYRAHSYWFLVRAREVIVLGLHQTSLWAIHGAPSPNPSWHQLSLQSRVIIQASEHRIASQVMGRVAAARRVLIGPSIFSPVTLGGAMRGMSPEEARTALLLQDEPFIPALQSSHRRRL